MNVLEFSALVFGISALAGLLGALTGLGGGVVITPALVLLFGVDLRYAIGASLVSVIATSSGAASAYVREGFSNIRIGMFLEVATTLGALFGAFLTARIPTSALAIIFGLVLLYSAFVSSRRHPPSHADAPRDALAERLRLDGSYPTAEGPHHYRVGRVKTGFAMMFGAGTLSGLLGIGSGALKVIAMDQAMRLPFKVSTTTSNFMIGVTAAASAGIYLNRGYIDPGLTMPVMLGVLLGSFAGAHILIGARPAGVALDLRRRGGGDGDRDDLQRLHRKNMMTRWTDEQVEEIVGNLLRAGVILAASTVTIGGLVYLLRHGGERPDFSAYHAEPPEFRRLGPILSGVLAGRGRSIIQLGLVLLVATPVARVAFSVVAFAKQRDRTYVVITLIVLAILVYSLAGGA